MEGATEAPFMFLLEVTIFTVMLFSVILSLKSTQKIFFVDRTMCDFSAVILLITCTLYCIELKAAFEIRKKLALHVRCLNMNNIASVMCH